MIILLIFFLFLVPIYSIRIHLYTLYISIYILEEEERILDLRLAKARKSRELAEQRQDCDEDGTSASDEGAFFLLDF